MAKEAINPIVAELTGLTSVLGCLMSELNKAGAVKTADVVHNVQATAAAHRASGNDQIADVMHRLSEYLLTTIPDAKTAPPKGPRQP